MKLRGGSERHGGVLVLVGMVALAGAAFVAVEAANANALAVPDRERAAIIAIADQDTRANAAEGSSPSGAASIKVGATTVGRGATNGVGAGSTTREFDAHPAYFVVLQGDFVGNTASRPAGARAPRGDSIAFVYDRQTGMVTDWSIGDGIEIRGMPSTYLR